MGAMLLARSATASTGRRNASSEPEPEPLSAQLSWAQARQDPLDHPGRKAGLEQLYADSASSGRVMALALHPFASGQPFRAKYLDQALEYITGHPGVWLTTSDEIAAHFARVRPQPQQGQ